MPLLAHGATQGDSGETFELSELAAADEEAEAPRGKRKPNAKTLRAKAAE